MDILDQDYHDEDHVLMPKFTLKAGHNWGVEVNELDKNSNTVHRMDVKVLKMKVRMDNAKYVDGSPQSLYWPEGHDRTGIFKSMAAILVKHGFVDAFKLRAQYTDFKCTTDATDCFAVPSSLEKLCKWHRHLVLFLPKFHCELNFIEQCWGFLKHLHCQYPTSSKEADLKQNVLSALDSVPLDVMHWFTTHAHHFMEAYAKGLKGKGAAWAAKKYCGHWVLPESFLKEFEKAGKA
ncbi:hypothetical protein PILCRDRAFT_94260 [Piloderma croceum F 1598]|uniref:Tc1-like transposase DDE domain-containing protein n=1 Tax=Piloderma croceum (strain F 1598) TaxID=765440 RepID=A0A0C3G877_PILCF|nr:hypothetical protein PILCRDRAFT_94260 [Piloderma croceum F 1598]